MSSLLNIAHRGSSWYAPENTWPAFERALDRDGADGIELDVQLGGDGEVYVLHDPTVDRTTNGTGLLRRLDGASIAALDAGYRFVDPNGETTHRGRGVQIPLLRDVLEHFADAWFSIDLKEGGVEVESAVARLLLDLQAADRCVVGAENPQSARRLLDMLPPSAFRHFFDRRAVRHFYLRHRARIWWGYRPRARSLQIPVVAGPWNLARPRLVEEAHRHGLCVLYWTVDDVDLMSDLLALGADGIITNRPDLLRDLLAKRATA